ncbi:ribosomal protein RPL14 [Besnoitia besnoiti]|uniref:Ribosomal protein RPL14 n=1 Tax=Besnoitia besnoiti TaxID=94643 RepID=A0A2A9MFU4_BESBE|nr:ribosomal protein RPL14 [Besnoitia besnoiti]PFH36799.1 ribosomal protein RPL14 [Besnoitia besnoiti]
MPLFTRYYQPGRLCVVQYGPDAGKLCFVVDIINQTRVLVDGAGVTGVKRQSMPVRRIALTDQYLKIPRSVRSATLKKALEKDDVIAKFNQTSWGKKRQVKEQRANMTDFDRFKLMVVLKQRRKVMQQKLKSLKK